MCTVFCICILLKIKLLNNGSIHAYEPKRKINKTIAIQGSLGFAMEFEDIVLVQKYFYFYPGSVSLFVFTLSLSLLVFFTSVILIETASLVDWICSELSKRWSFGGWGKKERVGRAVFFWVHRWQRFVILIFPIKHFDLTKFSWLPLAPLIF